MVEVVLDVVAVVHLGLEEVGLRLDLDGPALGGGVEELLLELGQLRL